MINNLISKIYLIEKRKQFLNFEPVFPNQIDVETTNACNLRCPICPQPKQTRKIGTLSFELARRAIEEISKYGLERMSLSLFGEPFLNKDFFNISRYAATGKIKCLYISTNGLLIDRQLSQQLLISGLDKIIISIDGASSKTYDKIRVGGDYDKVVSNTLEFIKLRRKHNQLKPILAVQIIRMKETAREIDDFVHFWSGRLDPQDQVDIKEYFTWAGKVSDISVNHRYKIRVKVPCLTYLWSNMAIHWNGDISVCCYDANGDLVLGNLEKDSLYNIWHGAKYRALRMAHLNGLIEDIPVCANCELTHRKFNIKDLFSTIRRRFI